MPLIGSVLSSAYLTIVYSKLQTPDQTPDYLAYRQRQACSSQADPPPGELQVLRSGEILD